MPAEETTNVSLGWPALRTLLAAAVAFALQNLAASEVRAQGKLDARYAASLAGIPIGKGAWVIDISDDQYTAAASGMTAGLLRVFASGHGSSAARGYVKSGNLIPSSYASSLTTEKRKEELRITLSHGIVKEFVSEPPTHPQPDRIPLTDAHRRGVVDPMSAALMRAAGNGDPISAGACNRRIPIFDGHMRFDLQLAFKRMDNVRAGRGYEGPVVVCAVYFSPIAGYVPDRAAIKYLVQQRDIEVWLAPIAGTRVLVPFKFSIPTPLGVGVLQATQFVSVPHAPRATATSAKMQ
jgi:hypothetical protein